MGKPYENEITAEGGMGRADTCPWGGIGLGFV